MRRRASTTCSRESPVHGCSCGCGGCVAALGWLFFVQYAQAIKIDACLDHPYSQLVPSVISCLMTNPALLQSQDSGLMLSCSRKA